MDDTQAAESTPTVEMQEFFPQSPWAYVAIVFLFVMAIPGVLLALSRPYDPGKNLFGAGLSLLFVCLGIAQIIYLQRAKIFVGNRQFIMFTFSRTAKIDVPFDEISSIRYEIPKH